MKTCILLSTCERYRSLADYTRARLRELWPSAPPLHLCGVAGDPAALALRADPRNWMRVTRDACDDLLAAGFASTYLLLEDHPPLGPCHSGHLNETLPAMMGELGAVSIALSGYGQGRQALGDPVRWRDWSLDRCRRDTLWKFPLHPALWRLDALRAILDHLIAVLPDAEQTPWAFERKGGAEETGLPDDLIAHSYRIDGLPHAAVPFPKSVRRFRRVTDVYRFAVRRGIGSGAREAIDGLLLGAHHYYHGPYPLVWSGLMRKGERNPNAALLLALLGRPEWIHELATLR